MSIVVRIFKVTSWEADIIETDEKFPFPNEEEIECSGQMAPDYQRETEFGPFRDVEAAREAVRRFRDEDTGEFSLWNDEAYEDLYEEDTNVSND